MAGTPDTPFRFSLNTNNDGPTGLLATFKPKIVVLGEDEDGETIDVCLADDVTDHTKPAAAARATLTEKEQTVLNCLAEALADKGTVPPVMEEIPSSVKCVVSADLWRDYVRNRGISTSDKRDTQDRAFRRASALLQKLGRVGWWKDNIWIVERGTA